MTLRLQAFALALLLTALPMAGHAADGMLPVSQQVTLLLKVLTYNRTLMQRQTPELQLAVVYQPDRPDSRESFEAFQAEFEKVADRTVRGHRVTLVPVPVRSAEHWSPPTTPVDIVYVAPVADDLLPLLTAWTRERKIVSVTAIEGYVESGISLALVMRRNRTGVTISAPASALEGSRWSEEFLGLCRIVGQPAPGASSSDLPSPRAPSGAAGS